MTLNPHKNYVKFFCASMLGAPMPGFRSLAIVNATWSECCWRTETEKNSCGIARFPCGSTAFLFDVLRHVISHRINIY